MSILAVGLSHQSADLATLENVTVPTGELDKALHELQQGEHVSEVMLLSTCNRVEVYAVVDAFHAGLSEVCGVLGRQAGVDPVVLYDKLYVQYAGAAVEHLFSVTAGLESMVIGETQILGQVRTAYAAAREAGTVGSTLHNLVQTTLRVGKRVHSETGLDKLGASVVSEALAAAGQLWGKRAVILGAGSMGALAGSQLGRAGIASVTVLNRTRENAERLVASLAEQDIPAHSVPVAELAAATAAADVVVCCTGAQDTVLTADDIGARNGVALTVCDLGLPRDVDPSVAELADVSLVDLETVRSRTDDDSGAPVSSEKQITQASGIILDEVREYLAAQRSAEVTPTVTALRKQAAEVVDSELLRLGRKLPDLDPTVRAELDRTVHRVADKLLHAPTVRVKELASRDGGAAGVDYADALRELFGLDPQAPAAVAKPSTRGAGDTGAGDSGAGDTRGESGDGNNT